MPFPFHFSSIISSFVCNIISNFNIVVITTLFSLWTSSTSFVTRTWNRIRSAHKIVKTSWTCTQGHKPTFLHTSKSIVNWLFQWSHKTSSTSLHTNFEVLHIQFNYTQTVAQFLERRIILGFLFACHISNFNFCAYRCLNFCKVIVNISLNYFFLKFFM